MSHRLTFSPACCMCRVYVVLDCFCLCWVVCVFVGFVFGSVFCMCGRRLSDLNFTTFADSLNEFGFYV